MAKDGGYSVGLQVLRGWYGVAPEGALMDEAGSDHQAMILFSPSGTENEQRVLAARLALRLWLQTLAFDGQNMTLWMQGKSAEGEIVFRRSGAFLDMAKEAALACAYDMHYAVKHARDKGSFGCARITGRDERHKLSFKRCHGQVRVAAKKAIAMQDGLLYALAHPTSADSSIFVGTHCRHRF